MAEADQVKICNVALILVGADEILTFADEVREAKVCEVLFQGTKDSMIAATDWKWARKQVQLTKLTTPPTTIDEFGHENAFLLPADMIRLIAVDQPSDNFTIVGENLTSNRTDVFIQYTHSVDELEFPPAFKRALEFELAALLSIALIEDASKAELWQNKANNELKKARLLDAQTVPARTPGGHVFVTTAVRT